MKTGRMSAEEDAEVTRLYEAGFTVAPIAKAMDRKPETIRWAMHRLGLRSEVGRAPGIYVRGGRPVRPFGEDEDAALEQLRADKMSTPKIAAVLTERFGHPRSFSSVAHRLTMLANREG